jgi:hypothetical protein
VFYKTVLASKVVKSDTKNNNIALLIKIHDTLFVQLLLLYLHFMLVLFNEKKLPSAAFGTFSVLKVSNIFVIVKWSEKLLLHKCW